MFSLRKNINSFSLSGILWATLFGIVGGVIGGLCVGAFVIFDMVHENTLSPATILQDTSIGGQVTPTTLSDASGLVLSGQIMPTVVAIVDTKKLRSALTSGAAWLSGGYMVGSGVLVTNDGWLVASAESIGPAPHDDRQVIYQRKVYSLTSVIIDKATGVAFVKIVADNLPVARFGSEQVAIGSTVLVADGLGGLISSTISQPHQISAAAVAAGFVSSEEYPTRFAVSAVSGSSHSGGPVFSTQGNLIGVVTTIGDGIAAIDLSAVRPALLDILKSGTIERVYAGIVYVDLAYAVSQSPQLVDQNRGALVVRQPLRNSPARLADIRLNDIITTIDGELLDVNNGLTSVLQQYDSGDSITLGISRAGKNIEATITLQQLP